MEKKYYMLGVLRIVLGFIFIWAFFDKLFGLGFSTIPQSSWINGGSPTLGYLSHTVTGLFTSFYHLIAGNVFVDWFFMIGLLFIGLALIFGIGVRIASISGVILMLLMWASHLPPDNHPFLDEHIIYALVFVVLTLFNSGRYLGLGNLWKDTEIVKQWRILE